ncbi:MULTISPECIES: c-type cytochrome biogenesis protein CcsB [Microbacterium]|jgi:cytochrome c-type biogenesis protein CcsB|uniref:c-type cytochrome biogenesis protein CcsB n=3 Tax=Microbacteriaceae TaxID=85023 RepID=UPI000C62288C|nr:MULTISPECIES: c-type cytochrome biogenesis protein CcsB [Microbacterium]MAB19723.1 c-type cytochrome biogenesis protein CcsB [Microbacterium sp.]MAY49580.1 c-type cytochrome biogenesis protein CcsB [Microbacterium sp.]HBS74435.1 c-type cytochrome biogenesis protein CcsB [Microbacterium sp.]|tara:strand:+ start:40061 stop:41086 length:1026 start_codon:yes stop_codon:yes gene_type:complete
MTDTLSLDDVSVLLVWTAIAVYALAFVAYAIDLARRSALAVEAKDARARDRELVAAGGESITDVTARERRAGAEIASAPGARPRLLWARIGTSLTVLAFLFHLGATVLRGIAAERVPWSNMYEFAMTGLLLVVAVYLGVLFRYDLRFLGTFITGLVVVLLGGATLSFYVEVVPLMDPLKSVWLVIHVFVASLGTALFALAFGLSVAQLLQARRERKVAEAADGAVVRTGPGFLRTLPSADALESLAYRFAIIGFIFWTFTLIAGAIWANDAWGRYWGFDTKEVWTFVIWVLYAGYIHARATRGWRGTRSAWLSIIGFLAVLFNFTIVNMFFKGLHAYSGLS